MPTMYLSVTYLFQSFSSFTPSFTDNRFSNSIRFFFFILILKLHNASEMFDEPICQHLIGSYGTLDSETIKYLLNTATKK